MKKKIFMISSFVAGVAAIAAIALAGINPATPYGTKAGNESYGITFDSSRNKFFEDIGPKPNDGEATVETDLGNEVGFGYYQVMGNKKAWHVLSDGGYFYNTDPIHGIESISITFNTDNLSCSLYYSSDDSFENSESFVSGKGAARTFDFDGYKPNYFKLVNTGGSNLNITSMHISLSCLNSYPAITLSSEDESMGSVSGDGIKKAGSNVTITATPNKGYRFVGWYDNETLVSTDASYSFVIGNSDLSYSARFTYESYNLVVTSEDETRGIVSGTGTYNYSDKVSVAAVSNDGYTFDGWYDDAKLISSDNPYSFDMPYNDVNYVARFSVNEYMISLVNENDDLGSITGAGTFEYGGSVVLCARPNKGVSFLGWFGSDGALVSGDTFYGFKMPCHDLSYVAKFAWTPYSVSVSVNDGSMGSVTGGGSYTYGQEVTLHATANEHYSFFGWYKDGIFQGRHSGWNPRHEGISFSMPDMSLNYEAKFVKNYKINVYSADVSMGIIYAHDGNGPFYPDISTDIAPAIDEQGAGLSVMVRAYAKEGYVFDYWCDADYNIVSRDSDYIFDMPDNDVELYAVFAKGYKLTVYSSDTSQGTVNDISGVYKAGERLTAILTCEWDTFRGWFDKDGEFLSNLKTYSFIMPSNDYTLVADFLTESEYRYATSPMLSEDCERVRYGLYPQTNIDDSSLLSALNSIDEPESNGWFLYDGDYYAKATAKPSGDDYVFSNGTVIEKGKDYWFRCEPIEWNVLDNDNGEYFVVSNLVLDAGCYYNSNSNRTIDGKMVYPNNYEYSDIRTWLNGDFFSSAFALGSENIMATTVDNSVYSTGESSNKYVCEDTDDKVFLLSYREAANSNYGFSSSNDRVAYATDYAKCNGIYVDSDNAASHWWLRSPNYYNSTSTRFVYNDGDVNSNGYVYYSYVSNLNNGVRPALRISLN